MPTITPKTVYPFNGKTYASLKAVKTDIENGLGEIIDALPYRLPPRDALALLELLVARRKDVVWLLSVEVESEEWDGPTRDIFDINL